jgi:uncharacterized protein (TIGR02246 family)
MSDDEAAVRNLIATWMEASKSGDVDTVLSLMSDDAVFSVCGREPFGKAAFAEAARGMQGVRMEGENRIVELEVLGDWAFVRAHIAMTMTPPDRAPIRRAGYTLTLLRKGPDGKWRLARDANMMSTLS